MLHGYKMMHLKCIQADYVVTQETIRQLLKILDPHGVQLRRRNRLLRQGSLGRSQDLKDLKDSDDFSGDFLDKSLIQFTCLEILERELQDVVHLWNTHRIRPSRNAVSPCGRPVMMYTLPQLFGAREYLKEASQQKIQACREEWRKERGPYPCDNTVFDICCLAMAENSLHPPTSPEEAIDLYMFLRAYTRTQI
ncbi:uncharacterized protein LOC125141277 [Tachysurus ichikawai]